MVWLLEKLEKERYVEKERKKKERGKQTIPTYNVEAFWYQPK